jgi:hypothetical protein
MCGLWKQELNDIKEAKDVPKNVPLICFLKCGRGMPLTCGFGKLGKSEIQCFAGFDSGFLAMWTVNHLLLCVHFLSFFTTYLQLYLDENGNVDVALTKREAELVESAKSNQTNALSSKKASRRRRSQAQDIGLTPNLVGKLDSAGATEFEGWVFGTFKDCKVGETLETHSFIFSRFKARF